jgi:hypothetical protein
MSVAANQRIITRIAQKRLLLTGAAQQQVIMSTSIKVLPFAPA